MDSGSDDESQALEISEEFQLLLESHWKPPPSKVEHIPGYRRESETQATGSISTACICARSKRVYIGLDSGELLFWMFSSRSFTFAGRHKGNITTIQPYTQSSVPAGAAMVVTGAADATLKVWDTRSGHINHPTKCCQTLHGHDSTVTVVRVHGAYLLSGSTDRTIRLWRPAGGRRLLSYPWFEQQAVVGKMDGWVYSIQLLGPCQEASTETTLWAACSKGHIVCFHLCQGSSGSSECRGRPSDEAATDRQPEDEEPRSTTPASTSSSGRNAAGEEEAGEGEDTVGSDPRVPAWVASPGRCMAATSSGLPLAFNRLHDRGIVRISGYAEQHLVFTLAYDCHVRVYNFKQGVLTAAFPNPNGAMFSDAAYDGSRRKLLAVDRMGYLLVYCLAREELQATKRLAREPLLGIERRPGTDIFMVTSSSGLQFWSVEWDLDYNVIRGGHTGAVVGLHACGRLPLQDATRRDFRVFSAAQDNTCRLWDPLNLSCLRTFHEWSSEISTMTFLECGGTLVTGTLDGTVRLWDLDTSTTFNMKEHRNTVSCMCRAVMKRNDEQLISADYDGYVCLWEVAALRNSRPHLIAKDHQDVVWDAHSIDCRFQAHAPQASGGGSPRNLSLPSLRRKCAADHAHSRRLSSLRRVTFREVDAPVAAGQLSGLPKATDPQKGGALGLLGRRTEILAIVHDSSKNILFTAGSSCIIKVWNMTTLDLLGEHRGHREAVTCLALDGNFLFSGAEDRTIRAWDSRPSTADDGFFSGGHTHGTCFQSVTQLKILEGHSATVTGLEVMPESGHLVSIGLDGRLLIWDYVTGDVLQRYEHAEQFCRVVLRYDADEILVGTLQHNLLRFPAGERILRSPV